MRASRLLALVLLSGAAVSLACGSDTKNDPGGSAGMSGAMSSAGTASAGQGAGVGGGTAGSAGSKATTGGAATVGGAATAGNGSGGASAGATSVAGAGMSNGGGGNLPPYAGAGVACALGQQDDEANRCASGQTCCRVRFGATRCAANVADCDPCPEPGECTAIACDEPADCPGGVCCATVGSGGGGVEFSKLTCQTSCQDGQYVVCATVADCPMEYTECGISSMTIRRCFH